MQHRRVRIGGGQQIRDAWVQWLSGAPWDCMVTLTWPHVAHPEQAIKGERYLRAIVNDSLYGKHWQRRGEGIHAVIGVERQTRGSAHIHALWRLPDHDATDPVVFPRRRWALKASELFGWSMIEAPRSQADVTGYVTKYVLKDGEIDLSPTLDPNNPRRYEPDLAARARQRSAGRAAP